MPEHQLNYSEHFHLKEVFRIEVRQSILYFIKALLYTGLFIYFYISLKNSDASNKSLVFAICFWGYLHALIAAGVWLLRNIFFPFSDEMSGTGCLSGCLGSVLFFGGGSVLLIFLVALVGGIILVVLDHYFNFFAWISSRRVQRKLITTVGMALGIAPFFWYWGRMVYCAISASKARKDLAVLKNAYNEAI